MGIFEGKNRKELSKKYPCYFEKNRFCFKMTPPDGESYQQIQIRIQCFIEEFTKILNENKGRDYFMKIAKRMEKELEV